MFYGTCSRWNRVRGFGWVISDGPVDGVPDRELFCHKSGLPKGTPYLKAADRVEFVLRPARAANKPPEARVLKIVEPIAEAA
jgi:cold shock CspA family protein